MSEYCQKPDINYDVYKTGDVRLYGRLLTSDIIGDKVDGRVDITIPNASTGVIYGYAFEGHCYTLPKPIIMRLPGPPLEKMEEGDCGYDPALGYSVWVTDKLERVVILDVRADTVKALVLDENTPGNRSPLAYSQAQALAPARNNRDY
jgi:hypothetical protein